jgi:hypothetical protein
MNKSKGGLEWLLYKIVDPRGRLFCPRKIATPQQ